MKTKPIDPDNPPGYLSILKLKESNADPSALAIVDHVVPERNAVHIAPPDRDDLEISVEELVSDWCEVVGKDAEKLHRQYFPTFFPMLLLIGENNEVFQACRDELDGEFLLVTVSDSHAALDLLPQQRVEIAFADFQLPKQDGVWLLEQIRIREPDIRRLLLSSGDVPNLDQHLGSGLIERFFAKNESTHDELFACLRQLKSALGYNKN